MNSAECGEYSGYVASSGSVLTVNSDSASSAADSSPEVGVSSASDEPAIAADILGW